MERPQERKDFLEEVLIVYPKRLIEVDLPIKRISAHARREKSIRHGHISTLHIWWARRPLAACRAVICAALWPDPADPLCPQSFREKAARLITDFAKKRTAMNLRIAANPKHGQNGAVWPRPRTGLTRQKSPTLISCALRSSTSLPTSRTGTIPRFPSISRPAVRLRRPRMRLSAVLLAHARLSWTRLLVVALSRLKLCGSERTLLPAT